MPVEVIVSTFGATVLLLAGYYFAGGAPALVTAGTGNPKPKKERPAWLDTLMFKGGGDGGSGEIRRQEEERQKKIKESTQKINRIFDQFNGVEYKAVNPVGGMTGSEYRTALENALTGNVKTNTERYVVQRNKGFGADRDATNYWDTRTVSSLTDAGKEALRKLGLSDSQMGGTTVDSYLGYYDDLTKGPGAVQAVDTGNSLYDQYRDDYMSYYKPQLKDQYQDAQGDVMYDLARRGATESSAGQRRLADLLESYNNQQTQLNSRATGAVNDYRSSVEQQRQSLISQAQAGMAPTDAANLASNAYSSLKAQTPEYDALGDVFSQFADVYGLNLRAQGAGFGGANVSSGSAGGLPGQSGTSKIRG